MERILFVMGNMGLGGAETHIMKVYRKINKTQYQFDFVLNVVEKCYYEDEILSLGGKIYRVTPKSTSIMKNYSDIKSIVSDNKYRVVFKCGEHALSWTEMMAAKRGGAKSRIIRSTNSEVDTFKAKVLHYISRPLLRHYVTKKVAPSKVSGEWMFGKHYCRDLNLVNNGINLDDYAFDKEKRETIREKYNVTNKLVWGHIGRFAPQKNHDFLINIFYKYHKENPESALMLVGNGNLQDTIKEKVKHLNIEDSVIFVGETAVPGDFYSAMDMFVFPSFYEGMPNTVIEAQASGLKCFVSDTITRDANITDNVEYIPLDESEWLKTIMDSRSNLRKNEGIKEMFERSRYDIDSVIDIYISLFGI